jgi:hypothetical protein
MFTFAPRHGLIAFCLLIMTATTVTAQTVDCPALLQQWIEAVRQGCAGLAVNQVCYGNPDVSVQAPENVRIDFGDPGDVLGLSLARTLQTSAFDAAAESWGVALLNTRANLLTTGVTLVAFGETRLENNSSAPDDFLALTGIVRNTGAIVRAKPDAEAEEVNLRYAGDRVPVIGRLSDDSWFKLPEGWVTADVVRFEDDTTLIPILSAESTLNEIYAPMQSFRLRTGWQEEPCAGAPQSGVLVQTPDSASDVVLVVNGAELRLTGTLLLQTTTEGRTVASLLEGVLTYGEDGLLQPAQTVQYGFNGDDIRYEQPTDYDYGRARFLPLVLLPREFELPFSLGGVLFPFTPGTGFLQTIAADGPCTVAWNADTNLRAGPGLEYPIRFGITTGFYGIAEARATGSDGEVWWRFVDSLWVAANITVVAGDCGNLPMVEPPPLPSS